MLGVEGGALLKGGLAKARGELKRIEEEYELQVDVDAPVERLAVGLQQRVEILKALYRGAETLILDEPTGVLTPSRGRPPLPHPRDAYAPGQDGRPHHPQAQGDHGRDAVRVGDAPRRDGRDARDRRDQPRRSWPS